MGTYKSNTRTVLNATLTGVTSYSSGILDVGDLFELSVDCNVTTHTGGHSVNFPINRIGADGTAYYIGNIGSTSIAEPLSATVCAALNNAFGDQIQIDLSNTNGDTVSATISIKGKG